MLTRLVFEGAHRVIVRGVALRFFLRTDRHSGTDNADGSGSGSGTNNADITNRPDSAWAPVTDIDFQHAYELAFFDPDALREDVLCPNARRVEHTTAEGWLWSDGCGSVGLCTFDDRTPDECAGMAQLTGKVTP
ncbi:hypothetical protein H8N00_18300 [Streptomyces sp. AC563]|uniref:hypothetical protein n=1 Tax=Streptomyces buecherae TaxID=2763006 RepID=UPI00164D56B8|nr:hypothetical protein [Streptomyces buecherae]MBC3990791.1 hypothetical protein [Streptomyces buecherae]